MIFIRALLGRSSVRLWILLALTGYLFGASIEALHGHESVDEIFSAARSGLNRAPAAPFTLASTDSSTRSLSEYKGKWVILNFWASWCSLCAPELVDLGVLSERLGKITPELAFINTDFASVAPARRWLIENKLEIVSMIDPTGAVALAYQVKAMPTTFIIRPDLSIAARIVGAHDFKSEAFVESMRDLIGASD